MSISLIDALRQVDLRGGRVYQCQVGRYRVEVRVEETVSQLLPAPLQSSDVMLDPWTDLPGPDPPVPLQVIQVMPAPPVLPDPPVLPTDVQP